MKNADLINKLKKLTDGRRVVSRGLGDSMAIMLTKLGVEACESCKKRQEALNKMFPYKRSLFK